MENVNLGSKIRELRKKKGITQDTLANALSVSPQAVSKWENGIALPDIALTPVIASYFGGKAGYMAAVKELETAIYAEVVA